MPDIDLRMQVDGVDDLMHGFQRVGTDLGDAMGRLEQQVLRRLKEYPSELPGQQYVRTFGLRDNWQVDADMRGTNLFQDRVSLVMRNNVMGPSGNPYAGYVQDEDMQARIHQGRWETAQQILADESNPFLDDVADSIERDFGG